MNLLWSRIYDVILKSLMSVDGYIQAGIKKMVTKNICFELLGFDILLDADMKPWLMEVNLSPSLATESPLDLKIKSNLFVDTMNLVCIHKYDRKKENLNKIKNRVKNIMRAKSYQKQQVPGAQAPTQLSTKPIVLPGDEKRQRIYTGAHDQLNHETAEERNKGVIDKIALLNGKLREVVKETVSENFRKNNFIRIYPTKTSNIYDKYFAQTKPLNPVLFKCLFTEEVIPFPNGYSIDQGDVITSPSRVGR